MRWLILFLPVRAGISLLRLMGDLHFHASKGKRILLRKNLKRIVGTDDDRNNAVREHFRNYYIDRLLIFIFPKFGAREVDRYLEFEGMENLEQALCAGNGAILLHGHFGPVHLPLVALARKGYPLKQIGNPTDEGLSRIGRMVSFRIRLYYENKIPAEIIKADSFLRPVFRWLGSNGIVMVTGDGTGTTKRIGRHTAMSFLGHPVWLPLGPYLLAEKTRAAILPMFVLPGRKKLYKIVIEGPLDSRVNGKEKIPDMAGQFIERLEKRVYEYPGYMHFLDRFHPGGLIIKASSSPG